MIGYSESLGRRFESYRAHHFSKRLVFMTQEGIYRTFRLAGIFGIGVVALLFPSLGENRFWLAGILFFVCIPLATILELRYPAEEAAWTWPFVDVTLLVVLINLVPEAWFIGMVIGAVIVGSAGVVARRIGLRWYGLLAAILVIGMSLSAIIHDVEGWLLAIAAFVAILPTVMFYANWEGARTNLLNHRAESLQSFTLVAGGVAHDFNNLLMVISGNADLALAKAAENGTGADELRSILEASDQAKMLTQQLLAFSGTNLDIKETVDLEAELTGMTRLLEKALPRGSALEVISSKGPFLVNCHHAQLQQVLMNIIINASEASQPDPAVITVTLSRETAVDDANSWVVVEVKDRGIGIPAELMPRIFDPFVSSKPMGHGLGLASAKRILGHHGGLITVESAENVGTTVRVRLPEQEARSPNASVEVPRNQAADSGLILVVDDDAQIRSLIGRQLAPLGFETISAADGKEGFRKFKEYPAIEAVVLDLKMPVMDGWECLSEMRKVRPQVPVVIISGYNPDDSGSLADYSNVTVLSKPFRLDALTEALAAPGS